MSNQNICTSNNILAYVRNASVIVLLSPVTHLYCPNMLSSLTLAHVLVCSFCELELTLIKRLFCVLVEAVFGVPVLFRAIINLAGLIFASGKVCVHCD